MRTTRTKASRSLLASLVSLCSILGLAAGYAFAADQPRPPLAIQFSLDVVAWATGTDLLTGRRVAAGEPLHLEPADVLVLREDPS